MCVRFPMCGAVVRSQGRPRPGYSMKSQAVRWALSRERASIQHSRTALGPMARFRRVGSWTRIERSRRYELRGSRRYSSHVCAKHAERLSDAPTSIFVIMGEDIRRSGITGLAEALRLAPNLVVARSNSNGILDQRTRFQQFSRQQGAGPGLTVARYTAPCSGMCSGMRSRCCSSTSSA